jgi:hypothetical protein
VYTENPAKGPLFYTTQPDTINQPTGQISYSKDSVEANIFEKLRCAITPENYPANHSIVSAALTDAGNTTQHILPENNGPLADIINQMIQLHPSKRPRPSLLIGALRHYSTTGSS